MRGSLMSAKRSTGLGRNKPMWRVYFDSAQITITSWYVEVDDIRVPVPALHGLIRCYTYRHPMTRTAAVTAGLELAIAAPLAVAYSSAVMAAAGLLSACGMAVAVWGDWWRNPRYMEIRAVVRGRRVVLFGTHDAQQFGFVWRALVRTVEANRELLP